MFLFSWSPLFLLWCLALTLVPTVIYMEILLVFWPQEKYLYFFFHTIAFLNSRENQRITQWTYVLS